MGWGRGGEAWGGGNGIGAGGGRRSHCWKVCGAILRPSGARETISWMLHSYAPLTVTLLAAHSG